jgi:hypothetical protein
MLLKRKERDKKFYKKHIQSWPYSLWFVMQPPPEVLAVHPTEAGRWWLPPKVIAIGFHQRWWATP